MANFANGTIKATTMSYLDPRADIVFRKIFGEHKNLCISLLNSLLPLPKDGQIESIEYMDPDVLPDTPELKNSVVDVRCQDAKGRTFIVEMQMYWTDCFFMRVLLNASKAFANQLGKGGPFSSLQPVYSLCLLNENMSMTKEYKDEYRHVFLIKHEHHKDLVMDGMTFVMVELQKFRKSAPNRVHKKLADLWLSFLTMMDENREGKIPEELEGNHDVNQAVECLKRMSLTREERYIYDKYWDSISCERTLLEGKYESGKEEGISIGEDNRARRMAKKMKEAGKSIEEIMEFTELSREEIEKL